MSKLVRTLSAALVLALVGCNTGGDTKPVQTSEAGGKKVTLSTASGQLTNGENAVTLTFTDPSGQPATVESPSVRFTMPAEGAMAEMNADAKLEPAGQTGVFTGSVDLGMKGPWQTVVAFKDAGGQHRATFSIQAQ